MARSLALAVLLVACQPAFDPPKPGARSLAVVLEPEAPLDQAPPVFRLRIAGGAGKEEPQHLLLFEGTLSAYHLGRIRRDDLPKTLLERQVPVLSWQQERDLVVAPTSRLEPGQSYALASPALGWVADVHVAFDAPLRERWWPPPDVPAGASPVVYCSDGPEEGAPSPLRFDPAGLSVQARRGLGGHTVAADRCRELAGELSTATLPLVPAPLWDERLVDPEPLLSGTPFAAAPLACSPSEIALGPACAVVEDDRLVLHAGSEPLGIALRTPGRETVARVDAGGFLSVIGLIPAAANDVRGTVFTPSRPSQDVFFIAHALPPLDRVVLNEVLANPLGPEPEQEWVELVNAGFTTVQLAGWTLSDGVGESTLPEWSLPPGGFALVVNESFDATSSVDVAPPPSVALLRVPALGKSGLSNAGEALSLSSASGQLVSRFPALPKPSKGGRSVARISPEAVDVDPSAFAHHAEPGASPGAPNVVQ